MARDYLGFVSRGVFYGLGLLQPVGETIKTGLLRAIEERLNEILEVAVVKREEDIPADFTGLAMPALYCWENEQAEPGSFNRLTLGKLDFWLEVFFVLDPDDLASFTAFKDAAATVAGRIANLFAAPGELRAAGLILVEPGRVDQARYNSDYGVLFMAYQLTYGHAAGDAFALTGG